MTRTRATHLLCALVVSGCVLVFFAGPLGAEEANFELAPLESVTLGVYILQYTGLSGSDPSYDLLSAGVLVAHFPSETSPGTHLDPGGDSIVYTYEDVHILTTEIAPDGTTVTGTIKTTGSQQ